MRKRIIALSAITALAVSASAAQPTHNELQAQIEALKAQLAALESRINSANAEKNITQVDEKRIVKLEKKVARNSKTISKVKAHDAGDNLKFDVDFRTQIDNIHYKLGNGTKLKNDDLLSNRLWLNMKYQADENSFFYGTLSYNKVYGDNRAYADDNTAGNNANFDWVTNEAATNDNSLKVKEAYWLYKNDSFFGNEDLSWTASVGRRPSTDGLGISLRADQDRKSALSHTVNVEFDGASARFNLDKLTGVEGMWVKFCAGRGLTNARIRFDGNGTDYIPNGETTSDIDMAGFIFVPWDNGQYSIHTNYAFAKNLIGNKPNDSKFYEFGDLELMTLMFKAEGIGDEISDFLDDTTFFASYAQSRTSPNANTAMLGSTSSETGHSYWIGLNMPDGFSNGRWGVEWNKGTKYWRSMTYGEDSMIGSKIATRGTAWELYYHKPLTKALSASVRFTKIDYDYTGSNGFFGDMGTPHDIDSANGATAVKEAQNITAYIRYRF